MRQAITSFLLLAMWSAQAADLAPDCRHPQRPAIPDGSSAKESELLAARTSLEEYLGQAQLYLECLRKFEVDLGENVSKVDGSELVAKYNAMVEEMYLAGDEFNIALRNYKAR